MMKTIDLFSGCGGMSLGFQNVGFKIEAAFDNWEAAVNVYRDNFSHPIYNIDLSSDNILESIEKINPEIIIGGPPCQDFSSAGKRDETLGRADLTITFANLIATNKPEWFVMENVERITKSKVLKEALNILRLCGYGITMRVLNASYCGVPQVRKRFFMVGHRYSTDNFLDKYLERNLQHQAMTVREYLGDSLGVQYYYRHPRSYNRRAIFSIDEPSPTIRGVNRPIPKNYKKHPGDLVDVSHGVRPLTTIERSYIQTFPKEFIFKGSKTVLEQIIGNAVPVKLAEYVANSLNQYIVDFKAGRLIKDLNEVQFELL